MLYFDNDLMTYIIIDTLIIYLNNIIIQLQIDYHYHYYGCISYNLQNGYYIGLIPGGVLATVYPAHK